MKKIDVETTLEVNVECGIISKFKVNKDKNTKKWKMKEMISTLRRNEKEKIGDKKQMCVKDGGY